MKKFLTVLQVLLSLFIATQMLAKSGECFQYNGRDINYISCNCNCYEHDNNFKGWCSNCWHYRNRRPQQFDSNYAKAKSLTDKLRGKR